MGQGATAYSLTGGNGGVVITTTDTTTGDFQSITVVGDAPAVVSATGTVSNLTGFSSDMTLSAGQTLVGRFTAIKLASGEVVAHNL
tara:strand:- start:412 stop:669 length:258 start_codon:yes stop_codon:yes gene_type:complete